MTAKWMVATKRLRHTKTGQLIEAGEIADFSHLSRKDLALLKKVDSLRNPTKDELLTVQKADEPASEE